MATLGYRRVSTVDQHLDRQDLQGCDRIFEEKASGASSTEREALAELIAYARDGDNVLVWSIDRLARDLRDLQEVVSSLNEKGVSVQFITERLTFDPHSNDALAKLQLQLMGAFAEFERNVIKKRQLEGIAKAKERGVYANHGRKITINRDEVKRLREEGLSTYKIAAKMGISRMSVHRILKEV